MPTGGVSGYAAISARVRAKSADLLTPRDMVRLSEAPYFATLLAWLKTTAYGPYLKNLKDKDIAPRRVIMEVKRRLADSFDSIVQMAPVETRPLIKQLFRYFEVGNLKAVLRALVTVFAGDAESGLWERVRDVLFPLGAA